MQTGALQEWGIAVTCDNNGGVYLGGNFTSSFINIGAEPHANHGSTDFYVSKYDAETGVVQWGQTFGLGVTDTMETVQYFPGHGIVIGGNYFSDSITFGNTTVTNFSGGAYQDMYLAGLSTEGEVLWAKSYGSNGIDSMKDMTINNEGNIYVTGSNEHAVFFDSITLINSDIYLAKTGALTLDAPNFDTSADIGVYPNPFTDVIHIAASHGVTVEIYDTAGRSVSEQHDVQKVDTTNLQSGWYIVKVISNDFTQSYKMMKR
jgi:hypothetical protein